MAEEKSSPDLNGDGLDKLGNGKAWGSYRVELRSKGKEWSRFAINSEGKTKRSAEE